MAGENEVDAVQENVGRENMAGSGEWPSPSTPPSGPAPGDPESDSETRGTAPAGGAREVLESDPVAGGSSSVGEPDVSG
jgi:hypothetical protein